MRQKEKHTSEQLQDANVDFTTRADLIIYARSSLNVIYNVESKQYLRYRYKKADGKRTAICIGYKKRGIDEARKIMIERIKELQN
jgi:hypothetical protein